MKQRIYICHTYYHVYVAFLKEAKRRQEFLQKNKVGQEKESGLNAFPKADVMLSTMANDFGDLKSRMDQTGYFNEVIMFHEKSFEEFPELLPLKKDRGNIVLNMMARIRFTKRFAKLIAPLVPVDLKEYKDVYVFCDSDPIGYYLNQNRIYYHAVEDGLNCIQFYDTARYDNKGAFGMKVWMSRHNLIFIQNGYGKYCLDMEVNDSSLLPYPCDKYVDEPRAELVARLKEEDKQAILRSFVKDMDEIENIIKQKKDGEEMIMVLSEPLCTMEIREQIFRDIVKEYGTGKKVFIKPHPRDILDYAAIFPEFIVLDGKFPMEMLNFIPGLMFDKVYSVLTQVTGITFAKECIKLGNDFMDRYEAPEIHRRNEHLTK